ncbi:MAG TPA: flavin reductase [Clostridia bacterium]|nr:flavin reductase [Clostridia bacterium]
MKSIKPEKLQKTPFSLIGQDWMLVTAQKGDKVNTMTASWGGMGVMWAKNVAFVAIRPGRYTKEFVDSADTFSLTFFEGAYKKEMGYLGSVSGRDEDKIAKSGLTVAYEQGTPYFKEAKLVLLCRKLYNQPMLPACFIDKASDEKWYPQKDYHTLYIAEIVQVLAAD